MTNIILDLSIVGKGKVTLDRILKSNDCFYMPDIVIKELSRWSRLNHKLHQRFKGLGATFVECAARRKDSRYRELRELVDMLEMNMKGHDSYVSGILLKVSKQPLRIDYSQATGDMRDYFQGFVQRYADLLDILDIEYIGNGKVIHLRHKGDTADILDIDMNGHRLTSYVAVV